MFSVPLLLLCVVSFSGATQVFPQSYEFRYHDHSVFSEPEATCPGEVRRNGKQYKVCYYDSEIRPKLMDCDLGAETYQDGGAYPLLQSGYSLRTFEFRFTFDPPLVLSAVILHYYSNCSGPFGLKVEYDHPNNNVDMSFLCESAKGLQLDGPMTENQNVTINVTISSAFKDGDGVFLGEIQFFSGKSEAPVDSCTVGGCCTNGATCLSSTVPNGYECQCPVGFYGVNCQFRNCTSEPCQNGGNCTDLQGQYSCTCPPGYYGRNCEMEERVTSDAEMESDHNQGGSSFPVAAAAAGTVVTAVVVILIVSGFVAVIVCYRRKKGKKSEKVIQHIGEDESNTYALIEKPIKAAPEVPPQNFDPVEEGLDKQERPPYVDSDPSTGQGPGNNRDHLTSSHSQEQPPASVPPSESSGPGDGGDCVYEDTVSAAKSPTPIPAPVISGIDVDAAIYSVAK